MMRQLARITHTLVRSAGADLERFRNCSSKKTKPANFAGAEPLLLQSSGLRPRRPRRNCHGAGAAPVADGQLDYL